MLKTVLVLLDCLSPATSWLCTCQLHAPTTLATDPCRLTPLCLSWHHAISTCMPATPALALQAIAITFKLPCSCASLHSSCLGLAGCGDHEPAGS